MAGQSAEASATLESFRANPNLFVAQAAQQPGAPSRRTSTRDPPPASPSSARTSTSTAPLSRSDSRDSVTAAVSRRNWREGEESLAGNKWDLCQERGPLTSRPLLHTLSFAGQEPAAAAALQQHGAQHCREAGYVCRARVLVAAAASWLFLDKLQSARRTLPANDGRPAPHCTGDFQMHDAGCGHVHFRRVQVFRGGLRKSAGRVLASRPRGQLAPSLLSKRRRLPFFCRCNLAAPTCRPSQTTSLIASACSLAKQRFVKGRGLVTWRGIEEAAFSSFLPRSPLTP